jgi:hypothetical protein
LFKNLFCDHVKGNKAGLYYQNQNTLQAKKITPTGAGAIFIEKRGR